MKTCVIAQPTFLPWLGWFDLADQGDELVLLDDVPFSKQSWQQRNRIITPRGLEFITIPVKTAGKNGQLIQDCEIVNHLFISKLISTLKANYSKSIDFPHLIDELASVLAKVGQTNYLADINIAIILWMAEKLQVKTPMLRASELGVSGNRGEHVAAICEARGATSYISPLGAEDYLIEDRDAFDRRKISVWIQMYEHPCYQQRYSPFQPYASAVDLIFNAGALAPEIMRSGRRTVRPLGKRN